MKFNRDFLRNYLRIAPAALALERSMECQVLSAQTFARPILDLGCGDGVFAAILCAEPVDVGVDYDASELDRARKYQRYDTFLHCGGDAVPRPDASFQTIFSNSVLEHIPDLMPVLKEQFRLLAPGGRFFITVPTDRWEHFSVAARLLRAIGLAALAERYAKSYNAFWRHYHAYPVSGWRSLLQEAGFSVIESRLYCPPNMTTMLDIVTPIAVPAIIAKKVLGRWIVFPSLRKLVAPAIYAVTAPVAARLQAEADGTLVFFALTK